MAEVQDWSPFAFRTPCTRETVNRWQLLPVWPQWESYRTVDLYLLHTRKTRTSILGDHNDKREREGSRSTQKLFSTEHDVGQTCVSNNIAVSRAPSAGILARVIMLGVPSSLADNLSGRRFTAKGWKRGRKKIAHRKTLQNDRDVLLYPEKELFWCEEITDDRKLKATTQKSEPRIRTGLASLVLVSGLSKKRKETKRDLGGKMRVQGSSKKGRGKKPIETIQWIASKKKGNERWMKGPPGTCSKMVLKIRWRGRSRGRG